MLALAAAVVPLARAAAQTVPAAAAPDSSALRPGPVVPSLFTKRDAWLALGFTAATAAALPFDQIVARNMQLPANQNEPGLIRAAAVFRDLADPGTVYVSGGLFAVGKIFGNTTLTEMGLHASEALVMASVTGFVLKGALGRPLPRQRHADADSYKFGRGINTDGNWQAFPSGHTLAAFAVASAVTAEAQWRWPSHAGLVWVLTYGAASAAGISRLYNNAHWVSDIVFGAGIGVFSGIKTVRFARTHPGNWFERVLGHASVAPAPGGGVTLGLHFSTGDGPGR